MTSMIPRHSATDPRDSSEGFTLLEILVSIAILTLLVVLLVGMTEGATRFWKEGERRRESTREARAGLEMMTEDLHSAVTTTNPATLLIKKEEGEQKGERLFFLVSHPREKRETGNGGDLCATGYFVAPEPDGKGFLNLYRFHASGSPVAEAFEKGRLEELYASASPTNSLTTELLARHIVQLTAQRVQETNAAPGSLLISLSSIGGETARILAANPKEKTLTERLLRQHLQRFFTIVHLPPLRELPAGS